MDAHGMRRAPPDGEIDRRRADAPGPSLACDCCLLMLSQPGLEKTAASLPSCCVFPLLLLLQMVGTVHSLATFPAPMLLG